MFDLKEDFMTRHKSAVRDPKNPRRWLFETGATYIEPGDRGGGVASEPSANPTERLNVQIRYCEIRYTDCWHDFEKAEQDHDIERMRVLAEKLKLTFQKLCEVRAEYYSLPEIVEQERQAEEQLEREALVTALVSQRNQEIRSQSREISQAVRKALPLPDEFKSRRPAPDLNFTIGPPISNATLEALTNVLELASLKMAAINGQPVPLLPKRGM